MAPHRADKTERNNRHHDERLQVGFERYRHQRKGEPCGRGKPQCESAGPQQRGRSPADKDVAVDEKGYTKFVEDPKGNTRILSATPSQQARVLEAFVGLATLRGD